MDFSEIETWAICVTVIFSSFTVFFSFLAYRHSKERFRLDLLEKRWEIYQKTLEFCSTVMTYGGLPKHSDDENQNEQIIKALTAANESFRGIGHHKTRSLFGPEIHQHFDELSKAYAWFATGDKSSYKKSTEKEDEYIKFIWKTVQELPDLFKPYVYFGNYKSSRAGFITMTAMAVIGRQNTPH